VRSTECLLVIRLIVSASDLGLPKHTTKFCSVVFGVTSKLPVINTVRGAAAFVDNGRRTTHYKCYNLYSAVEMLTTRDGPAVIDVKAIHYGRKSRFLTQFGVHVGILP